MLTGDFFFDVVTPSVIAAMIGVIGFGLGLYLHSLDDDDE